MTKYADFLVEIGTEELPPKEIDRLAISFKDELCTLLKAKKIAFTPEPQHFGAPRRLAVLIKQLALQQDQQTNSKIGPLVSAAFDASGNPTQAALGFAKSCGIDLSQAKRIGSDKGEKLYYEETVPGQATSALLPSLVEEALKKLPIKKYMRWGNGDISFVRPIHWIVMLLGSDIVSGSVFGIASSNISYGHRILSGKALTITDPNDYESILEQQGKIIPSFSKRKANILEQINKLASSANSSAVVEPELLNTVTGLVEHPVALMANFDPAFLRVPKECLISSMQDHQKCFALTDKDGNLLPKFILISNISSTDPQTIVRGNELVMHARLADAAFYFDKDQKQSLAVRREQLKEVVYVKKLGSIYDKTERIKMLAEHINKILNEYSNSYNNAKFIADGKHLSRAAELCKSDLLTSMVYEFPELQGIMGCYYAQHDQEPTAVAVAIQEHYLPRFAEDTLPTQNLGTIIGLADRIDTLTGMFGIGNIPTGDKDPYGLRRQGIALLRLLIENCIDLNLKLLNLTKELYVFLKERLKFMYLSKGFSPQTVESVLSLISEDPKTDENDHPFSPIDIDKRIYAVQQFQKLPAAESLAAANKRVHNLLQKNTSDSAATAMHIDESLLAAQEEKNLVAELKKKQTEIEPMLAKRDYTAVLQALASLQGSVDAFFNHVMVMDEDLKKRNNRLNILKNLRNLFLTVADVSLL